MISDIKEKVIKYIRDNPYLEVNRQTKCKASGIYMIYIDDFSDDKIVPIYIGQTSDFQKRYKEHFSAILALNRLKYDYYRCLLKNEFYDMTYRYCKILKYMIDHGCTLKDFHMIVLEFVEKEDLHEKEQLYFADYMPSFCGFNQLNSFLETNYLRLKRKERMNTPDGTSCVFTAKEYLDYCEIVKGDLEAFYKFEGYGFSKFNLMIAMRGYLPYASSECVLDFESIEHQVKKLDDKLKTLHGDFLTEEEIQVGAVVTTRRLQPLFSKKNKSAKQFASNTYRKFKIKNPNKETRKEYGEIIFFASLGCDMKEKLSLYFEKNKLEYDFQKFYTALNEWLENDIKKIDEEISDEMEKKVSALIPDREYSHFPLEDMYESHIFPAKTSVNTCEINFSISNNGHGYIDYSRPEIIKIDYRINAKSGLYERRDIFIENFVNNFFDNENSQYTEKDDYEELRSVFRVLKKTPFKIFIGEIDSKTGRFAPRHECISVNSEYKTGINEFTAKDRELHNLTDVLTEIEKLIDSDAKIKLTISESKDSLLHCLGEEMKILSIFKNL